MNNRITFLINIVNNILFLANCKQYYQKDK